MDNYHVRASSISGFFSCPSRWAAAQLDGITTPSTPPAVIGSAVHESTAAYDTSRMTDNTARHLSVDDAAEALMQYLKDPGQEVDWQGMRPQKAATIALGAHTRYCSDIAPLYTYTAVEETLDDLEIEWEDIGVSITLTGTLDRLYQIENAIGVADVKTGATACSQTSGKHKAQLGCYELLAENRLGVDITLPGQLLQLQTSANYKVGVAAVENARIALLGDDNNTGMLTHIARALKTGDFWGNPTSWLCSQRYCGNWDHCIFR
jgi:RecB family exonuclease